MNTAQAANNSGQIVITSNDADESPFRFNIAGTVINIGGTQPDLAVTAAAVQSFTANSISYSYTFANQGSGTGDLSNVSVQGWFSRDPFLGGDDLGAGGFLVLPGGQLLPGQTRDGLINAGGTINPSTRPFLIVEIDSLDGLDESNEGNNFRVVPLITDPVAPGLPQGLTLLSDTGDPADRITAALSLNFAFSAATDQESGIGGYWWSIDDPSPEWDGQWTASLTLTTNQLAPGNHQLYIRAIDRGGNLGPVANLPFSIDTTSPVVTTTQPIDGSLLVEGPREILVDFSESMSQSIANLIPSDLTLGGTGRGSATVVAAGWVDHNTARFTIEGAWGTGLVTMQLEGPYPRDIADNILTPYFAGDFTITGTTSNNTFSARSTIGSGPITVTGNNSAATKEPGEPSHHGNAGGRSLWWTWTAPATGNVQISTIGSNFDTLLAIYTGSSVSALALVASDDDSGGNATSRLNFAAIAGTSYQIAVDGYNGASGDLQLNVSSVTVSAPEIFVIGFNPFESIEDGDPSPEDFNGTAFGSQQQHGLPVLREFTIFNLGTAPLILGNVNLPEGFTLLTPPPANIAVGSSGNLLVQMDTTVPGLKSGQIEFTTNDSDENPFNFSISGSVQTETQVRISLPKDSVVTPGQALQLPLLMETLGDVWASGIQSAEILLYYDPAVFSVSTVELGSLVTGRENWSISSNIDSSLGRIIVSLSGSTRVPAGTAGELLVLRGSIAGNAPPGKSSLNIVPAARSIADRTQFNQGLAPVQTAPTIAADDATDGMLRVLATPANTLVPSVQSTAGKLTVRGTEFDDEIIVTPAAAGNQLVVRANGRVFRNIPRPATLVVDAFSGRDFVYIEESLPFATIALRATDALRGILPDLIHAHAGYQVVDSPIGNGEGAPSPIAPESPEPPEDQAILQLLGIWEDDSQEEQIPNTVSRRRR